MARLEDLTVGSSVTGVAGNQPVTVLVSKFYGDSVLEVTYKDAQGVLGNQLLYREDEARLSVGDGNLPWSFDADADQMRLASEAYRIRLAHLFDPYLAVHTSQIEPLPHQISAVYQEMLPRLPLRYILADDPGIISLVPEGTLLAGPVGDAKYPSLGHVLGSVILWDDLAFDNPNIGQKYRDESRALYANRSEMCTPETFAKVDWDRSGARCPWCSARLRNS